MNGDVLGISIEDIAKQSKDTPFDAIVVGAGSAGLTAARTLAEKGKTVALIEAGPAPFLTHLSNTEIRYHRDLVRSVRGGVTYSPKLENGDLFGRNYSCFGGRGLFWNGSSPRYRAHDFDDWPFDDNAMEATYQWAEREFRVTTALGQTALASRMISALGDKGIETVPGPFAIDNGIVGNGHLSSGIASGLAPFFRSAGAFLISGQIRLAIRSQVLHVLKHSDSGDAAGVTVADVETGNTYEVFGLRTILAAGGTESVRIAGLSGVDDPHERIGKGLQDHIFYRCYLEGPEIFDQETRETAVLHIPSTRQDGEQWEIQAPGRTLFLMDTDEQWKPAKGSAYQIMIRAFAATEKRDENFIEVHKGGLGSSTIHFTYSQSDEDMKQTMAAGADDIAKALGLSIVATRLFKPGDSYHEAGGLDMGTDKQKSVTNPRGEFHGMANLYCLDAAAFPKIGATNPHLTIMAESRRKAQLIK